MAPPRLALRLQSARLDRGWSIAHLAAVAGLAAPSVRAIESGRRRRPPGRVLAALSDALGVALEAPAPPPGPGPGPGAFPLQFDAPAALAAYLARSAARRPGSPPGLGAGGPGPPGLGVPDIQGLGDPGE